MAIALEDLDGATKTAIENLNSLLVPFSHQHIFANALADMPILLFQMGDERHCQSPAGLRTILQIEQLADTLMCKAQILEALDNSQPAQLRLRIEAKTAGSALFWFDEPQLFVVANRARGDAGLSGQIANLHRGISRKVDLRGYGNALD